MLANLFKDMMNKMLLLWVFIPLIAFRVEVAVGKNEVHVEISDTYIQTAECSFEPGNKLDVMALSQDAYAGGNRNLANMSWRCSNSSCLDPTIRVAVRRHMPNNTTLSKLTIGWEPSLSKDAREDVFMCTINHRGKSPPKIPASLRQFPARKFRWYINKTEANVSSDSLLEIEFRDEQGRWNTIHSRNVGQPKEQATSIKFYDPEGGAEGVNILKLVDTAKVAVVTLLISHDSRILKDPRCRIKVGNKGPDCKLIMSTKQGLSEQNDSVNMMTVGFMIGCGVLIVTLIPFIIILVKYCKIKRKSSHGPERNNLLMKPQQEENKDTSDLDPDPKSVFH